MSVKPPRARTLGVLLTLLALGLLPAHGVLHHHHDAHGAPADGAPCGHGERGTALLDLSAHGEGPCTLCHQLASGAALACVSHLEEPASGLSRLACESDVDRRDSLRTRACVRGPPGA